MTTTTVEKRQRWTMSKKSWHGRIWLWWTATGEFKTPKHFYQENLCHYLRVVLIWAPLDAFLLYPIVKKKWQGLTPASILVGLALLAGYGLAWARRPLVAGIMTGGAVALVGLGFGIITFVDWCDARQPGDHDPSFAKLAWEYGRAKKHRICPLIEVNGKD